MYIQSEHILTFGIFFLSQNIYVGKRAMLENKSSFTRFVVVWEMEEEIKSGDDSSNWNKFRDDDFLTIITKYTFRWDARASTAWYVFVLVTFQD